MKKAILTFGLFSLMMVLTSFTSANEIGGNSAPRNKSVVAEIGGNSTPRNGVSEIGGNSTPRN